MLQKQLSEIFRILAHGRRSYGGFVRVDNCVEHEILKGQRLAKLRAESAIKEAQALNRSIVRPKVTYITLQAEDEALVAWFFTEGDEHGTGSI